MIIIPSIITASIFTTVEFYVIVSVIAAAVVALASLPERKGEVKQHLLAGDLIAANDTEDEPGAANGELSIKVHQGNIVSIVRSGLRGVSMAGAVSFVVKVSGFDIVIEERITAGMPSVYGMAASVQFTLDFLGPEWYHLRYESESFSEHAAFALHVREGITMSKKLIH